MLTWFVAIIFAQFIHGAQACRLWQISDNYQKGVQFNLQVLVPCSHDAFLEAGLSVRPDDLQYDVSNSTFHKPAPPVAPCVSLEARPCFCGDERHCLARDMPCRWNLCGSDCALVTEFRPLADRFRHVLPIHAFFCRPYPMVANHVARVANFRTQSFRRSNASHVRKKALSMACFAFIHAAVLLCLAMSYDAVGCHPNRSRRCILAARKICRRRYRFRRGFWNSWTYLPCESQTPLQKYAFETMPSGLMWSCLLGLHFPFDPGKISFTGCIDVLCCCYLWFLSLVQRTVMVPYFQYEHVSPHVVQSFRTSIGADSRWRPHSFFGAQQPRIRFHPRTSCLHMHTLFLGYLISYLGKLYVRVVEATNPGPGSQDAHKFHVVHYNPTAIFGKLDDICSLPLGVHLVAETSHTRNALRITKNQLFSKNIHSLWSEPVVPYTNTFDSLRGMAGGTAILSHRPLKSAGALLPEPPVDPQRVNTAFIQIKPHLMGFVASIYGPPKNSRYCAPEAITDALFSNVVRAALAFQGPAIIAGDFNTDLDSLSLWPKLQALGWFDAAMFHAQRNDTEPENTCKDATRHSFILCSKEWMCGFCSCKIIDFNMFSAHPVLALETELPDFNIPIYKWVLPQSFDDFISDSTTAQEVATRQLDGAKHKIESFKQQGDVDALGLLWTQIAENTLASAATDSSGQPISFKRDFFGRCRRPLFVRDNVDHPIPKQARWGDLQCVSATPTVEYRRHLKQAHRLQSLVRQIKCFYRNRSTKAADQLEVLWTAILNAKGFTGGFASWIFQCGAGFIPTCCPDLEYAAALADVYLEWHASNTTYFARENRRIRYINKLLDLQKGGKQSFKAIADESLPPMQFVHKPLEFSIPRQTWPKLGKTHILCQCPPDLRLDTIKFQGQQACIVQILDNAFIMDKPIKLWSQDLIVKQDAWTLNHNKMHQLVASEWNSFFQRDERYEEEFAAVQKFVDAAKSETIMQYSQISQIDLYHAIKTTKKLVPGEVMGLRLLTSSNCQHESFNAWLISSTTLRIPGVGQSNGSLPRLYV